MSLPLVISGTYFTASEINIPIDLSNKYAGSKISYSVSTSISECEITVLFAPTIEIAKLMSKYKNSILKFNPMSYLEHDGKAINSSIRETIINSNANELALYNNGITILSDETNINERIDQKNKAQLRIKNPQIINGGQTVSIPVNRTIHF
ncbi:AIPR family protein [Candidatus Symbiopectobacterium sp. 'North America']|uniref:AIPR family protein n=1 Tax=Candidatus Symbiopectobacterium sp. 'North America' TaxID=2794574 RepID=UPI0018CBAD08|nr:AIPR family protein [Candidatus Symbiopectobacterium sp. 'North America']